MRWLLAWRGLIQRLPWVEALVTFILGFVLYFVFKEPQIGILTWIVGSLLTLSRLTYEARLERELQSVRKLAEIIDLSQDCDVQELQNLFSVYLKIHEPEFKTVKEHVVGEARNRLLRLANDKASEPLPPSEYYLWLLPIFNSAPPGSTIRAVSVMNKSEWDDSPMERRFIEQTIAAAKRGVSTERVFVMPKSILSDALQNPAVRRHAKEEPPENVRGYLVDRDSLKRNDPGLDARIGDGFIAFERRVALIDIFKDGEARGKVTMHPAEISRLIDLLDKLRLHSEDLSTKSVGGIRKKAEGSAVQGRPAEALSKDTPSS